MPGENNIRVSYLAFNQPHEEILPKNMTLDQFRSYMMNICKTVVITEMQPTSRIVSNTNVEDDGC